MSVKKSRYRRKNAEGLYDTYHFETEVDQVNGLDDYMLEKMKKIAEHNTDATAHANGISGNAATATKLKATLNGSRNQCWLLCKLPKTANALVHYKILGAQYYDQYSTLEVVIKNGFGWCEYTGSSTNYQVSIKAYDSGTTIDVYLFAPNFCDTWELFLQKNDAVTEFSYKKVGDATYTPAGTLVYDTTGKSTGGKKLFNGKELLDIDHNTDTTAHTDIREELKKAGGMPLGSIMPFLSKTPPAGWLSCDTGAIVSRATYPELWTWVQANAPLISEAEWQAQAAEQSSVGAYSAGDGSTTFRLPRIVDYVRGGLTADVGNWQGDAIRNIVGSVTLGGSVASAMSIEGATGAFGAAGYGTKIFALGNQRTGYNVFDFDASKIVPIAEENRPKTIKMLYCVKAFNAETNQGLIDITALANEMTSKVDKTDIGFTVIYPNGGTNVTPANVAVNSRYVCDNPFTGFPVICKAEVYYNGQWGETGTGVSGGGYGVFASVLGDKIIVQTGSNALLFSSNIIQNSFGNNSLNITTPLSCRVKIWKLIK